MITIPKNIKELIEKSLVAFATCDKLMRPNVIVIGGVTVVSPNQLLLTDNQMDKTKNNLLVNGQVSLAVWQGEEAYQLKGNAQYITSGPWKKIVDKNPRNKLFDHKAAVLVTITEIWDLNNVKLILKDNY